MFEGRFEGQVAIVTGGGRGIGECVARRLAAEGAKVAVISTSNSAQKVAESIDPTGKTAAAFICNVVEFDSVKSMVEEVIKKFGKIDILINSAGITKDKMFHKMDEEIWKQVIDINLTGTFNVTRNVVPYMREQKYGRIVNLSSSSAYGSVGQANYAASKAGLLGFTKTLAKELAKHNVTINAVLPEFTETDMVSQMPKDVLEELLKGVPMGRAAKPEEQASAICFLASYEASFITGAILDVNGGVI